MSTFTNYFLAAYFLFVALFYAFRLKAQPLPRQHIGELGSRHWYGHISFRLFRVLILAVCVLRIPFPELDQVLLIFNSLSSHRLQGLGVGLLVLGFFIALLGHYTLGYFWQSGINPQGGETLVTKGVYSYSRNPMFIGVLCAQLGFFFALPSVFSGVCLLVGHIAILNQVGLEEKHLAQQLQTRYLQYCSRVPRWLGWKRLRVL